MAPIDKRTIPEPKKIREIADQPFTTDEGAVRRGGSAAK